MTEPQSEVCYLKGNWDSISGIHHYGHKAMATTFGIFIAHEDAQYAKQAAWEAFQELDRLEAELSRFIENSDVSRINNLPANHSLPMSSLAPGYTSFAVFPSAVALYSKGQIAVPRGAQLFSCRGLYTQERGYASESSLQRSRKKHVLFLFFRACRSR